ncbi:MAG: hypothetical protein E7265_10165 [Lachnospiraceae bacterium]|nr:hypothetical protein [Lachnospiraceae bacterium]
MGKFKTKFLKKVTSLVLAAAMVVTGLPAEKIIADTPDNNSVNWEDNLLASYDFEENLDNGCDTTGTDKADVYSRAFGAYSGDVVYEDGEFGKAVRVGDYGLKLKKENIGKEFTISMWVKPDGSSYSENDVLLFLGNGNPEQWIGVSVDRNVNLMKVWGKGGNLTTWTTLSSPTLAKNEWHNLVLIGTDGSLETYVDGTLINRSDNSNNPLDGENMDISIAVNNWDTPYKALVDKVKIYDAAVDSSYLKTQYDNDNLVIGQKYIDGIVNGFSLGDTSELKDDISLPSTYSGATVTWETSDAAVITKEGVITRGNSIGSATLTATVNYRGAVKTKDFNVTVAATEKIDWSQYQLAEYNFEENVANSCEESENDEAVLKSSTLGAYAGDAVYEDGIIGKAIRVGDYGLDLDKKNIGKDFTISMWVKPDSTYAENEVMLFLGNGNPEQWIGVSGERTGTNSVKIWGKGANLNTWTTLTSTTIDKGDWHHLVLVGSENTLKTYVDGVKVGEGNNSNNPLDGEELGIYLAVNYWDKNYCGLIDEVKIYNTANDKDYVEEEYNSTVESYIAQIVSKLNLGDVENVKEDISLPKNVGGATVQWQSGNESVITSEGVVTRGLEDAEVTLTANITYRGKTANKQFNVTVAKVSDGADVAAAKEELSLWTTYISSDMYLPTEGILGTSVTWKSSDTSIITDDGKLVKNNDTDTKVTLTATISKGIASDTKEIEVTVMAKPYAYIVGYVRGNNDRTGSLHIAYSKDGKEYTALNGNSGILFAKIDTNDQNKKLATGIRFDGIGLFRNSDGSFGVVAPQGKDNNKLYVYTSEDMLSFGEGKLVEPGQDGYDFYKAMYDASRAATEGVTLPADAAGVGIMGVSQAELDKLINRFAVVENTGIELELAPIEVDKEDEVEASLPKTATAKYSDGSEAVLDVKWDIDKTDMSKSGTYTLEGEITTYVNPLAEQRADPQIMYDEVADCYYMTASYPAFGSITSGYNRIALRKADSISGLADVNGGVNKEVTIWQAPSGGDMSRHVWAPELHKINGKWYVFFAAGNESNVWGIRPYILVCQNNEDPYNPANWKKSDGTYEIYMAQSKQPAYFKQMSLDMTYFEHNGKHYVIWADIIGQSALYMQEIDPEKPWIGISDDVICLTTPEFGWERDVERVNEGATILKHDGKIFCAFSASGTGPEYCIGMIYADEDSDLMDESSWTKLGYPLLTSADVPGEFGPGHNSFTVDKGGNPVFVYHARSQECYENRCEWANDNSLYDPCRHARVKNVHWTKDGLPILKMSAEEECPEEVRKVSIQVTVKSDTGMNLENAVIEGYESDYEISATPIKPDVTVSYKGTALTKDVDYTVEYGANNAIGEGTITIKAVEDSECFGTQTVRFNIIEAPDLKVYYDMSVQDGKLVNKAGSGYEAALTGITDDNLIKKGNVNLLKLGNGGYASIPKDVINDNTFTISVVAQTTKNNDQWLWALGKDSWAYAFFTPTNRDSKAKFTVAKETPNDKTGAYSSEKTIAVNSVAKDNSFHVYTAVVNNTKTELYIDGKKVGAGENPYDITSFFSGLDVIGYIGKSLYTQDPPFNGNVGEFKVYDNALTEGQVAKEAKAADLDAYVDMYVVETLLNGNSDLDNIKTNVALPTTIAGKKVTWEVPTGQTAIAADGTVTRSTQGKDVTVVIKASWDGVYDVVNKSYTCTVKAVTADSILEELELPYSTETGKEIYGNITLPEKTVNGIDITWKADKPEIIDVSSHTNTGYDSTPAGTVTRPETDTVVKLTAEITLNGKKGQREYQVTVKAAPKKLNEDDYTDYFFAYFTGEGKADGEQIYFASSEDGLNWSELNNGKPSLISTLGEKGVRDPYIIRSHEGDKFYIIATDLKINGGNGWGAAQNAGSQSLMVWESTDLVNWSNQRMVEVSASIDAGCTWAPEATYDAKTGEYIVYWASKVASDNYSKQRVYYSKTRDFYSFTEPEVFIEHNESSIDTTIISNNGTYYRYTKNEGGVDNSFGAHSKTVFVEKSDALLGEYTHIESEALNNNHGVEGPAIFKLGKDDVTEDTWCLLVDNYGAGGYYPLLTTDLDSGEFTKPEAGTYKMPNGARHGTPIRITREEYCKVMGLPYEPDTEPGPQTTNDPDATPGPQETNNPDNPQDPSATDKPNLTPPPAITPVPSVTEAPSTGDSKAEVTKKTIKKLKITVLKGRKKVKVSTIKKATVKIEVYKSKSLAKKGKSKGRIARITIKKTKNKKGLVTAKFKKKIKKNYALRVTVTATGYKKKVAVKKV